MATVREVRQAPVIWLTGLPGVGKTTLARELTIRLRRTGRTAVILDGDELREVLPGPFAHDHETRLRLARSYARLCKLLSAQGVLVVCATVSFFESVRAWNRANLSHYVEVLVSARSAEVASRRPDAALRYADLCDDTRYCPPTRPDMHLQNDTQEDLRRNVELLEQFVKGFVRVKAELPGRERT